MAWIYLFFAGIFEVVWAVGLKYSQGFTKLYSSILTLVAYAFGQIHLQSTHKLIQHISSLITRSYLCLTSNNIGTKLLSDIRQAVYRSLSFANRTNYPAINFNIDGISTILH